MNSQLLTPNDVAAYCQVSPKTVLRAIQSGRLRAARLGVRGAYRVSQTDMETWITESTVMTIDLKTQLSEQASIPLLPPRSRLATGGTLKVEQP